jgi:cell division protein FtsI (penicillin-binding protein 3)
VSAAPRKPAPPRRWDAEGKLPGRRRLLAASFGVAALLIVGRGVQLQGFEGEKWRTLAAEQQQARVPLPARRGGIFDRDGTPLALTRESWTLNVAPRELRDRDAAVAALAKGLGMSRAQARRATDPERRWVVVPGRWSAEQRKALGDLRGLHWERNLERFYPQGEVGREVLGGVSRDGRALGGIEQELDALLRGTDGYSVLRRDARGQKEASISLPVAPPRDGADVYLTLDFDLQEIADAALTEAVAASNAAGGDLLLADPRTGEVLAAVSRRGGANRVLAAFVEPYEPGSTLKPFFVASLLAGKHATLGDRVFAENGSWRMPSGRVITDVHAYDWLALRDGLRVSSNITMAKLSARIPPAEQFRRLRDLGFGTATGIEYPAEASGRLPRLSQWSDFTPASVAMGYEISVTPLQLAMAYGALANGGVLMEPHLLREVRSAAGETLRRVEPRALRRAIPRSVADSLRRVLVSVVDDGTAKRASLSTFEVAGKTGTARRTGAGGRYEAGSYNATFAGFFPAQDPQLAIFVRLDRPQGGGYTGGVAAAPVTRETLQAILAARSSTALNGRTLLATRLHPAGPAPAGDAAREDPAAAPEGSDGAYVFLDGSQPRRSGAAEPRQAPVPALAGLPLRDAARRLHALGFHVRLEGSGRVAETRPAAGTMLRAGDTVAVAGKEGGR